MNTRGCFMKQPNNKKYIAALLGALAGILIFLWVILGLVVVFGRLAL